MCQSNAATTGVTKGAEVSLAAEICLLQVFGEIYNSVDSGRNVTFCKQLPSKDTFHKDRRDAAENDVNRLLTGSS